MVRAACPSPFPTAAPRLWLPIVAYVLLLLALARIGAIAVPVNPELNAKEAGYILRDAEEPDGLTPAHPVSDKELPAAQ